MISSGSATGHTTNGANTGGTVGVLAVGAATTSTHEVNPLTSVTNWGSGAINAAAATTTLTCGSCHNPHGNGNYRTLRPAPVGSGVSAGSSVTIADVSAGSAKVYITTNYWQVADATAGAYIANVSAWCVTCHTRYLAAGSAGSTDSTDAIYKFRHLSNGITQGSASCIQCHVAHGSNAAMTGTSSGAAPNPAGVTGAGSRLLRIDNRGTCQMCPNSTSAHLVP